MLQSLTDYQQPAGQAGQTMLEADPETYSSYRYMALHAMPCWCERQFSRDRAVAAEGGLCVPVYVLQLDHLVSNCPLRHVLGSLYTDILR